MLSTLSLSIEQVLVSIYTADFCSIFPLGNTSTAGWQLNALANTLARFTRLL